MSKCKFCGKEIVWLKDGRKNIPVEGDGAKHSCDEMKNARSSFKTMEPTDVESDIIAQYEKAMNEKKK
ncbi:MAG: hypothetical protein KAG61_00045 [Bacteriovoracaceae bacterium]|nr:hypothetical protein [Bacteriovoracaceae bacterium]